MTLPSQSELKIITRIWNVVEKQGFSVIIMGAMLFGCYRLMVNMERQDRKDDVKREKREVENVRYFVNEVKDCKTYTRDVFKQVIEGNTEAMIEMTDELEKLRERSH